MEFCRIPCKEPLFYEKLNSGAMVPTTLETLKDVGLTANQKVRKEVVT